MARPRSTSMARIFTNHSPALVMTTISSLFQLDPAHTYSYADYLTWQLAELVEVAVKGRIWKKGPAPKVMHQRHVTNILRFLANHVAGHSCEVFVAPFDVRLSTSGANRMSSVDNGRPAYPNHGAARYLLGMRPGSARRARLPGCAGAGSRNSVSQQDGLRYESEIRPL